MVPGGSDSSAAAADLACDRAELTETAHDREPERVAIDPVVVVHDEVPVAGRLRPNGIGESGGVCGDESLGEFTHAIRERFERERKGGIGIVCGTAALDEALRVVEGPDQIVEPSVDACLSLQSDTASSRMRASRPGSSERLDTTSTGRSRRASRSISN
jgi:hypothetical protein